VTKKIVRWAFAGIALALAVQPLAGAADFEGLRQGLKEVDQKLRDKNWAAAEKQAGKVAHGMRDEVGTGPAAAHTLAVATALRAVAESGLGRNEDAAWHWDMALNLDPEIAKVDVSPYGAPAEALRSRQLRPMPLPAEGEGIRVVGGDGGPRPEVERPKLVKRTKPKFPAQLRDQRTQGGAVVECVIGRDGRPRDPHVLRVLAGGPSMVYESLEALRQWRFAPARLKGEPVEVYFTLMVNFRIED
jgi:TonB family protein